MQVSASAQDESCSEPIVERRVATSPCVAEAVYAVIESSMGGTQLPGLAALWRLRRRLAGADAPVWRMVAAESPVQLAFEPQIELPGQVRLTYRLEHTLDGCRVTQECRFEPSGWRGRWYWNAVYPAHALIFEAMLRGIVKRAARD